MSLVYRCNGCKREEETGKLPPGWALWFVAEVARHACGKCRSQPSILKRIDAANGGAR